MSTPAQVQALLTQCWTLPPCRLRGVGHEVLPAAAQTSRSPLPSTMTFARTARRPCLLSKIAPRSLRSSAIDSDDPAVHQQPHSLADQQLVGLELQPLRVDHRRAADGLTERGQPLAPVRHLPGVGRAPQLGAGPGEGLLGQPVQQLGTEAGDDRGACPSRSSGRSRSPVRPPRGRRGRRTARRGSPAGRGAARRPRPRMPAGPPPTTSTSVSSMHGDLTGGLGDRGDGRRGGRGGARPIRGASRGEQSTSPADPGAEVALWVALALWLVHCSLI